MPKIFEYFGLVFYFFAHEHLPIHVHVRKSGCQDTFELVITDGVLIDIKLRKDNTHKPLSVADQRKAKTFIQFYYAEIISKWFKVFVLDVPVESEKVEKPVQMEFDTNKIIKEVAKINEKAHPLKDKKSKK